VPVSARLSHHLHATLGEEAGGDLVTWMQTVDASRSELRDLLEMYSARTDSRFRELEARLDARFAKVDTRFAEMKAQMDARLAEIDARVADAAARVDVRFADVDIRFERIEKLIERTQGRLLTWSFGFWATTLAALYAFTRPTG
jgi:anti-sigma-K factor RskA